MRLYRPTKLVINPKNEASPLSRPLQQASYKQNTISNLPSPYVTLQHTNRSPKAGQYSPQQASTHLCPFNVQFTTQPLLDNPINDNDNQILELNVQANGNSRECAIDQPQIKIVQIQEPAINLPSSPSLLKPPTRPPLQSSSRLISPQPLSRNQGNGVMVTE